VKKTKKKIVFLLTQNPHQRIAKRAKSMSRVASDILIIYWNRSEELQALSQNANIKIRKINSSMPKNLLARILIDIKLLIISYFITNKASPEIIYIEGLDLLIVGYIYKFLHKKTKIIYEISDIPGGQFKKNIIAKGLINISNKLLKNIDLLVLTSLFYWEEYFQYKYPYKDKVIILENLPEKRIFGDFKSIKHKKLTIGFIGSVRYPKQIINLFKACTGLHNIQIIIAGGGPDYEYIKNEAREYPNVTVTGPFNYEKNVISIYKKIDLIYCVYDTNLFNVRIAIPNKLYEAIVCNIPIIVAKKTKLSELVKQYEVGFEVSADNSEDVKKLIINILKNPEMLKKYKKNAKKIKEKFYFENIEKDFLKKLQNIL